MLLSTGREDSRSITAAIAAAGAGTGAAKAPKAMVMVRRAMMVLLNMMTVV